MNRFSMLSFVALLGMQVACSPAPPAADAPIPAAPSTVAPSTAAIPDTSPDVPPVIAALAESPLPGEWSVLRSEGLAMAQFRTKGASDAIAVVACVQPARHVEFLFAPSVRSAGRASGDNRLLTLSVITATERLDLSAVDWSKGERYDLRAGTDARDPSLAAVATPQERIAFETDYFEAKLKLVFPWDASIATVLKECGG